MKAYLAMGSLCAGLALGAMSVPAWAADPTPPPDQPAQSSQPGQPGAAPATTQTPPPSTASGNGSVSELVVTGSLIKKSNFTSPTPMDVITHEQALITGQADTAQLLQLSAVAASGEQINNSLSGFGGFAGGAGSNTLSLRGLGSDRTLILIDGERLGPAGVSGFVGPVDLNTIPTSIIDHVEFLKDGASSIYGSDAVAGVVNIITKQNQDGGEIHVYGNPSEYGGGNTYQIDGSFGKTWDKGYVSVGFDWYRQNALTSAERPETDCQRDDVTAGGRSADIIDPTTGQDKCFGVNQGNEIVNGVDDLSLPFANFFIPSKGTVAGSGFATAAGMPGINLNGFQATGLQICGALVCPPGPAPGMINTAATRTSLALQTENSPDFEKTDILSPVSRYTVTLRGGYNLGAHTQVYGSFMFNQRDSSQTNGGQFFDSVNPTNAGNPGFGAPLVVLPLLDTDNQTVNYYRGVIGIKGDLPNLWTLNNWTYDVYGQASYNDAYYTTEFTPTDRANSVFGAGSSAPGANTLGPNGASCNVNAVAPGSGPIGRGNETMAALEPGKACVPINLFQAASTGLTPAQQAFLFVQEQGHTTYLQTYMNASATGNLFNLPAGPVGAAIGFYLDRESLYDNPGTDSDEDNLFNLSSSGITQGSEETEQVFGELSIPIAKNLPLIKSLNVDLSDRYSNYNSFGGDNTYKASFAWEVTDWFEVRGTYGTSFRAPTLFEQFLAPVTFFQNQLGLDPCINFATSGVSATVQKNCASLGIPGNFPGGAESATINEGGGSTLKPETSDSETIGVVFTPRLWGQSFSLAVDYYDFDIDNEITEFGATNIVAQCMEATNFPANPFCSLFTRDLTPGTTNFQAITSVDDDFVNVAKQLDQGLDVDVQTRLRINDEWKASVEANLDWTFLNTTTLLGESTTDFLGTIGEPTFDGNVNMRLDHGPWSFDWYLFMVGASNDSAFSGGNTVVNFRGTGQTVTAEFSAPFYTTSTISVERRFDKFTIHAGIKNLFNATPPNISVGDDIQNRTGTIPFAGISQYDLIGRSFFLDVSAKF